MGDIVRATITGAIGGYIQQNVLQFEYDPDHGSDFLQLAAFELRDHWIQLVRPLQASDFRYSNITTRNMSNLTQPPWSEPISIFGGGGTVQNWWGPMAVVFSIRTAIFGRKGRGRFYLGGFYVGQVGQGQFTASAQGQNTVIAGGLITRYIAASSSPMRLGVGPRNNTAANFNLATNIIAQPTPGVQRRRNFGVGI